MDTDNARQQLMELWKRSFDDTDAFVLLFFTHVYRKENALYIEQGGRIVSALQMLPYTLQYYGMEIPVSYIYGACTHPEERGKGWMSTLIQKAFKVMAERHIALTVIIPAEKSLFDYYRRFGYTEAFDYATETILPLQTTVCEDTDITVASADASEQESLFHYFDRKQRERPCYVLHNQKDFTTLLHEPKQSGGQVLTAVRKSDGRPIGMLFCYPVDNRIEIREGFYDTPAVREQLLQAVLRQYPTEKVFCRIPPTPSAPSHPLGMARIIDRDRLIRHWLTAHPDTHHTMEELQHMNAPSLTHLLLGYARKEAYLSLMLD